MPEEPPRVGSSQLAAVLSRLFCMHVILSTLSSHTREAAGATLLRARPVPSPQTLGAPRPPLFPGGSGPRAPERAGGARPLPSAEPVPRGLQVLLDDIDEGAHRASEYFTGVLMPRASAGGSANEEAPWMEAKSAAEAGRFFEELAEHHDTSWYAQVVPRVISDPLNAAFRAYANASNLPMPLSAAAASAAKRARASSAHQLVAGASPTDAPRCRGFAEREVMGRSDGESGPEGFVYWVAVTCSCVYSYWGQSMGTMLPIAIWEYAGWTEEFWRLHRRDLGAASARSERDLGVTSAAHCGAGGRSSSYAARCTSRFS